MTNTTMKTINILASMFIFFSASLSFANNLIWSAYKNPEEGAKYIDARTNNEEMPEPEKWDPKDFENRLTVQQSEKAFLIRESTTMPGVVTVTYALKSEEEIFHARFYFLDGKWHGMGDELPDNYAPQTSQDLNQEGVAEDLLKEVTKFLLEEEDSLAFRKASKTYRKCRKNQKCRELNLADNVQKERYIIKLIKDLALMADEDQGSLKYMSGYITYPITND